MTSVHVYHLIMKSKKGAHKDNIDYRCNQLQMAQIIINTIQRICDNTQSINEIK